MMGEEEEDEKEMAERAKLEEVKAKRESEIRLTTWSAPSIYIKL
jgi:hypothetical protein